MFGSERRHPAYLCVSRVWVCCRLQAKAGDAQGRSSTQAGTQIRLHIGPTTTNILHPPNIETILKLCEQKADISGRILVSLLSFTLPPPSLKIMLKFYEQKHARYIKHTSKNLYVVCTRKKIHIVHFLPVYKCSQCFYLVLTPLAGLAPKVRDVLSALRPNFLHPFHVQVYIANWTIESSYQRKYLDLIAAKIFFYAGSHRQSGLYR